jgi:hypothetical protein
MIHRQSHTTATRTGLVQWSQLEKRFRIPQALLQHRSPIAVAGPDHRVRHSRSPLKPSYSHSPRWIESIASRHHATVPRSLRPEVMSVGLTPTGVQRPETRSLARLISRPDQGRQPTDGCGPPSGCAQIKEGEGLGDEDTRVL